MSSIKFDNTEILDTTHIPQFVKHESAPSRSIVSVGLAREDGDILISERYGSKIVTLKGTLKAASQDALDAAIDTFKELFSRPERNLDISWNGSTRRYVATCTKHEFDRDHYNINAVPWTAEFLVSSGVGKDTTTTLALDEEDLTTADDGDGNFVETSAPSLTGSKAPLPIITLEIVSADADTKGIEYKNTDTGERIIITRDVDWSAATGKQIIIDCENKKVTDNLATTDQVEGNFFGIFPRFSIGTNNVQIQSGGIINQRSSDDTIPSAASSVSFSNTNTRYAVSFQVPYSDDTFGGLILGLAKNGSTTGSLFGFIKPDDGGEPDYGGTTIASWSIPASDISDYPDYTYVPAWANESISLEANTTYWLIIGASTVSGSFHWYADTAITYPRGSSMISTDGGSTWTTDSNIPSFRLLIGGLSAAAEVLHTVSYVKSYL